MSAPVPAGTLFFKSRQIGVSLAMKAFADALGEQTAYLAVDFGQPEVLGERDSLLDVEFDGDGREPLALQFLEASLRVLQPLAVARLKALGVEPLPFAPVGGTQPSDRGPDSHSQTVAGPEGPSESLGPRHPVYTSIGE